ncbi:MAG: 5'-3' exonuclease [Mariniblastus sp.]|jgi:5'-3' exonuclease
MTEQLIAIDATNRIHALWHGTQGSGTVALFFRQLESMVNKLEPTWTVACFDQSSFRKKLDKGYKASRTPNPEIAAIIDEIKSELHQNWPDVPACELEGMEADDLLASFAATALACGYQAILLTGDKDCRQCLRAGQVTIMKKLSIRGGEVEFEFETANDVLEIYGVAPESWQDYQALIGDAGDDIEGAVGIGPKTASELIRRIGSLDEIIKQPSRCPISKRQIDSLVRFRSRVDVVKQLVTLRTDLDVSPWLN